MPEKLNIWLLQIGEPLPLDEGARKMRTAILADKLAERGHNVLWWASAFDHLKKDWVFDKDTELRLRNGIKIKALRGIGYKKNISISRFIDHRIIARKFRKSVSVVTKPDIIIASFPAHDLAYEAVVFARKNDIPIIVDVRDYWPDIFLEHAPALARPIAMLLLHSDFKMAEYAFRNATHLTSMLDDIINWALGKALRKRDENDRVYYLGGTKTPPHCVEKLKYLLDEVEGKSKWAATFIGTFGKYNDPSILVEAAKKLPAEKFHFVLGGDGELFNKIKRESADLQHVTFTGWLSPDEISFVLSFSKVGIVPCSNRTSAFPNKVFTYLADGVPIIFSVSGDLERINEKCQIGLYYTPKDTDTLVEHIKRLHNDRELHGKMSANARKVFDEMFDADKIYDEFAKYIESAVGAYKKRDDGKAFI